MGIKTKNIDLPRLIIKIVDKVFKEVKKVILIEEDKKNAEDPH